MNVGMEWKEFTKCFLEKSCVNSDLKRMRVGWRNTNVEVYTQNPKCGEVELGHRVLARTVIGNSIGSLVYCTMSIFDVFFYLFISSVQ